MRAPPGGYTRRPRTDIWLSQAARPSFPNMAREKIHEPRRLDVRAFAAAGAALSGTWPQTDFERLVASLMPGADAPAGVDWSVQGEQRPVTGGAPQTWLRLSASTTVALQCQRCLQPVAETLAVERWFRFADDEQEAERLDEELEDDVLVASRTFDLHELVEDELILALPLVPRHEVCPEPLPMSAGEADEPEEAAPNPFAALAALKRQTPD